MTARQSELFEFPGRQGQLSATLELPHGRPLRGVAVFAHCFACGRNAIAAVRIARDLAERGFAVLRFDFAGIGESEGSFGESGLLDNAGDIVSAVMALEDRGLPCRMLIGHSYGGAAAIAAASQLVAVDHVVTIGAPFEVDHILATIGADAAELAASGGTSVTLLGRKVTVTDALAAEASNEEQATRLANLVSRLLVIHARDDAIVPFAQAERLFLAAGGPKAFATLHNADHLLTAPGAAAQVAKLIDDWFAPDAVSMQGEARPSAGTVTVATRGGAFAQVVRSQTHDWLADEPIAVGGEDLGPSPYDHLLAALGTCTSMAMMVYARRKGIPLERVEIELEHGREHAADCTECHDAKPGSQIDILDRAIRLHGPLDNAHKADLMRIADRCPVHRTLENRIEIKTTQL